MYTNCLCQESDKYCAQESLHVYIYIYLKNNYAISLIFGMHKLYSFGFDQMTFFFINN